MIVAGDDLQYNVVSVVEVLDIGTHSKAPVYPQKSGCGSSNSDTLFEQFDWVVSQFCIEFNEVLCAFIDYEKEILFTGKA